MFLLICIFFSLSLSKALVIDSHYRKDAYLDQKRFNEKVDPMVPKDGGRVHIVATYESGVSGLDHSISFVELRECSINGVNGLRLWKNDSSSAKFYDWFRCLVDDATKQVWISFHSRNTGWFPESGTISPLKVRVVGSDGTEILDDSVEIHNGVRGVTWTWVALAKDGDVIVHYRKTDGSNFENFYFDGVKIDLNMSTTPGKYYNHMLFKFKPPYEKKPGDMYTVRLDSDEHGYSNGGKLQGLNFPISAWGDPDECAFPELKGKYSVYDKARIDTFKLRGRELKKSCDVEFSDYYNDVLVDKGYEFNFLLECDQPEGGSNAHCEPYLSDIKNFDHIAGIMFGDECDSRSIDDVIESLKSSGEVQAYLEQKGFPVLGFDGGCTNHRTGMTTGHSDIKSIDMYIAGCAPCIIEAIHEDPIDGALMYIRNARENHMPLPVWGYSQFFWHWQIQPNAKEIIIQLLSSIIAGSKGIPLFEAKLSMLWSDFDDQIGPTTRSIKHVGEVLRTGDIDSMSIEGDLKTLQREGIQVVRNHEKIVVLMANFNAHGYSQLTCHAEIGRHWKWLNEKLSTMRFRSDQVLGVANITEVVNGKEVEPQGGIKIKQSSDKKGFDIENCEITASMPVRIFIMDYTYTLNG